jgi:CBS domain-containing protein
MLVKDVLNLKQRETTTIHKDASVRDAMDLLISNRISCLPVVHDDNQLEGIISDKDIFRHVHDNPDSFTNCAVGKLMTTKVIVGLAEDELSYIAGIMTNNRVRHIPIVADSKLIGLVSVGDVVKTQMESIKIENRYLKQYIGGDYPA